MCFSCIFTFLEIIKQNVAYFLLSSRLKWKQKFINFGKFFKYTLIWQLSQYNRIKLFRMKLKTTKHYQSHVQKKLNNIFWPTQYQNLLYNILDFILFSLIKKDLLIKISSSGWYGSVDWAPACKPKGHQFNFQSAHMPGLQARFPVQGRREATTHWCFSPSLSLFPSV